MMDKYSLRHLMTAIIVGEELRVPSINSADRHLDAHMLRTQFTPMLENAYYLADLMLEIGDRSYDDQ